MSDVDKTSARASPAASSERIAYEMEQLSQLNMTLAADLDLDTLTQTIIDTATRLTGAAYGSFFERVVTAPGEPECWRLASLTGAPLTACIGSVMSRRRIGRTNRLIRPPCAVA